MPKAKLIRGDWELEIDLQEYSGIVNLLTEGFFALVRKGLKAPLKLYCDSQYVELGTVMSAKCASESIQNFFEDHTQRVLKDEGGDEVFFEIIEGNSSDIFTITQEKGN